MKDKLYIPGGKPAPKPRKTPAGAKVPAAPKRDTFTMLASAELGVTVEKEYRFHPKRMWRFDYAIPSHKIAIEVEGGVWTQGRHTRGKGFLADMEKYNTGAMLGWRLLRFTPDTLYTGATFRAIRAAMDCPTAATDPALPENADSK